MDIQIVTDVPSLIQYLINYLAKNFKGVSKFLRDCLEKIKKDRTSNIKQEMMKLGSCFVNAEEISAPAAVYSLLSMPQCTSSRDCIFLNTSPMDKRTKMLKSKTDLERLNPNSKSIYVESRLDYYKNRPEKYDSYTLA